MLPAQYVTLKSLIIKVRCTQYCLSEMFNMVFDIFQDHLLTNGKSRPVEEKSKDRFTAKDAVAEYLRFNGWIPKS